MSLALVSQLDFAKQMPIEGNCQQEISISVPSTGSGDYNAGTLVHNYYPPCGSVTRV